MRVLPRPTSALVGRLLIAPIYVFGGISKLATTHETAAMLTAKGMPSATTFAIIAGLAELLGGLAIATGFLTRVAAVGLVLYMIPTTLLFHDFWNAAGVDQQMQLVNFMKNVAIVGGLALLFAFGPGRFSIDARLRRPMQP